MRAAQSAAFLEGRDFVKPDDVKMLRALYSRTSHHSQDARQQSQSRRPHIESSRGMSQSRLMLRRRRRPLRTPLRLSRT